MALTPPASDNVSPVTDAQNPATHLTHVGARSTANDATNGLPTTAAPALAHTLVTRAYNLAAEELFRRELLWDMFATKKATRVSHRGATVQFNFVSDLDDNPANAKLQEDYDVLPTPLTAWSTDVTMEEYGKVVTTTALLRGTSMIPVDPIAAERVARNAASTIDRLAFAPLLVAGGINNDGTPGAAPVDVTVPGKPSDTLRKAAQTFREKDVPPFHNGLYIAVLSPAAETALRSEADAAGWRYWQINQEESGGTGNIARGAVGIYEGFEIHVANTPGLAAKGGVFLGWEALAKGFSTAPGFGPNPGVVISPVVDRLRRFASVGWYHLVGYERFRAESTLTGDVGKATP